ncbi:hypothetical protein D5282_12455 [bacterium 1xD8-48]|nr:hypothetical protein [bacterium 1xD8-48]
MPVREYALPTARELRDRQDTPMPSYGALYHSPGRNPKAGRGTAPVAGPQPLAVNLRTGRGLASVTFSLIYGAYGRLYGGTVAARRPGCAYEDKNLLISEKRGKSL